MVAIPRFAGDLADGTDISDPKPERGASRFGGSQAAYRREYRAWHAREQRRKKIAAARFSPLAAAAPTATIIKRAPGPAPRVVGGPDHGKLCWWDSTNGFWRQPNGSQHVVKCNARRAYDRWVAIEEASRRCDAVGFRRARAARRIQMVVRTWRAKRKALHERKIEAAHQIQKAVRARQMARREAARKAAAERRIAEFKAAAQRRRAAERKDCQRWGTEWRSRREGSDDLGLVLADSKVYLEGMPSLADEYAMLRGIRRARNAQGHSTASIWSVAPAWDEACCHWYVPRDRQLNHFQAWLPADVIESRWYHIKDRYYTKDYGEYEEHERELTYLSCPTFTPSQAEVPQSFQSKQRDIEQWARARPARVRAEEAVEDAADLVKRIRSDIEAFYLPCKERELHEAEAALAEAIRHCDRADEAEAEQEAAREAKTAKYVQQYEAHLAIVRQRHPHLLRAYHRGKEALVRLSKANALIYSANKHELLTQLVNADVHGCASLCDARGRPGRCPRCAAKLHLVCSPSNLQPNRPIRLECKNKLYKKGGQTMGGARSCIGSSFEWCGWKADITAENKSELLSVRIKDSWERDLLPVLPASESPPTVKRAAAVAL